MESAHLERPQGHGGEEQQQPQRGGGVVRSTVVEEEEQHDGNHHEKKSVLKKVKAKAKKIKDTLTHPGHCHDHHDHDRDDEESLEDDDEMVEDPNVHDGHIGGDGAVTSTVIKHKIIDDFGPVENPKPTENPSENPNKDRYDSGLKEVIRPGEEGQETGGISHNKRQPFVSETHHTYSHGHKGGFLQPEGLEKDPHAPSDRPGPPSNYQSKTFDPTGAGGKEARISPLVESFGKMDVSDDTKPQQNINPETGTHHHKLYTGSHDQFAPEPVATNVYTSSKDTESIPKTFDPNKPENLPRDPIDGKKPLEEYNYAGKTSPVDYAKSAAMTAAEKLAPVYDKVAGAGNAVMEKLPIGGSGQQFDGEGKSVTSTVKEKLAPVYDKVAAVGSTLVSKAQGPGTGQAVVIEGNEERNDVSTDKGVSITEYLAEKLKPGEEDKALSDMISGTLISGTLSRQKEEMGEAKAVGRVTESEEVARRLGPIGDSAREGSEEKGMVDMLRGAVNSWLGRDNQPQTTETRNVRNEVSPGEEVQHQGERRLEHQNAMAEGRSRLQESGH